MKLDRNQSRVKISWSSQSPIEGGVPLVLGLPSLRGGRSQTPPGPRQQAATTAEVDDLPPLVYGTVDTRLDNFKQLLLLGEDHYTAVQRFALHLMQLRYEKRNIKIPLPIPTHSRGGKMPIYKPLFDEFFAKRDETGAERAARGILKLRNQLRREIPARNLDESLLLASWNLREFGRNQKYGPRMPEAIHYIAEVMAHFDLIAVQEIHQNLSDLTRLMRTLGPWWTYIVTDVTPGRSGNQERTAFVFDTRKIVFDHLAGELVLPPHGKAQRQQPARSPFICAFRAGWRRVSVCCVHIYYGTKDPNDPLRVAEIEAIAGLLAKRNLDRQSMADGEPDNVILLGDFNIFNQEGDETTAALERSGFVVPKEIRLLRRNKYYDQIVFHDPRNRLKPTTRAGVFDFSDSVFRPDEAAAYDTAMAQLAPAAYGKATSKEKLYRDWRTFQMSDHLPLWLELKIDFANNYLAVRGRLHKSRGVKSALSS